MLGEATGKPTIPSPGPGYVWDPVLGKWVKKAQAPKAAPAATSNPYAQDADTYLSQFVAANIAASQPTDYSGIPERPDEGEATKWVQSLIDQAVNPIEQQRLNNKAMYDYSKGQATTFGQALVSAFAGGLTGDAADAYATKEFGSKWATAAALWEIAIPLMGQIQEGFTKSDMAYRDRIADIFAKRPELIQERLAYMWEDIKNARSARDLRRDQRIQAAAALKVRSDEYAARAQQWESNKLARQKQTDWFANERAKFAQRKASEERLLAQYEDEQRQQRFDNARDMQRDAQRAAEEMNQAGSTYVWKAVNGQLVETKRINPVYIKEQRREAARLSRRDTGTGTIHTVDPKTGVITDTGRPTAGSAQAAADDKRQDAAAGTRGKSSAASLRKERNKVAAEINAQMGALRESILDGSATVKIGGLPDPVPIKDMIFKDRKGAIAYLRQELRRLYLDAGATGRLGYSTAKITRNIDRWISALIKAMTMGPPAPR